MGVTIHYQGTLRSAEALPRLGEIALKWAAHWKVDLDEVDRPDGLLFRFRNGTLVDYHGPVRGFRLHPHPESEMVLLLFDEDLYVEQFTKTQFANPQVHVEICALLREIEPYFSKLTVVDDGGYWDTEDRETLEQRMNFLGRAIDAMRKRFPQDKHAPDRSPKTGLN